MFCSDSDLPASFLAADSRVSEKAGGNNWEPVTGPSSRLFIERRRKARREPSGKDTLKALHQRLAEYENEYRLLAGAEESYRRVFEAAPIGFFRVNAGGKTLDVNAAMAHICGYERAEEMISQEFTLGERVFAGGDEWNRFLRDLEACGAHSNIEVETQGFDGSRKRLQLSVCAVKEYGRVTEYIGTVENITERRLLEDEIRRLAYFDTITGLPNRLMFEEELEKVVSTAHKDQTRVALMLLEIGRFKMINDSFGRLFGERLLKETAARIREAVGEKPLIARLSGAEFAIILENVESESWVEAVAQRIATVVNAEVSFQGNVFNNSSAIGISMFPRDAADSRLLLERADAAMCSVTDPCEGGYQFFTEEMNQQLLQRLRLENGLCQALERAEFFLVYQPQFDIRTYEIAGVEALLRWKHPELGLIPPSDFIGIAESSGLIIPIGEWVLRTACAQARKWQADGLRKITVAVNVSAVQFRQKGFCDLVRRVIEETGLDPEYLELELTEGTLLNSSDLMFAVSQELREIGVKLAIDDFGTGYSSLSYLRHFKVNRLKIDRSFVRDISESSSDSAITAAIINMAKALDLGILAEGVESAEQLDFLRRQNCFEMQGFYFSVPLEVNEIESRLQQNVCS